jgi:hypothetical protein
VQQLQYKTKQPAIQKINLSKHATRKTITVTEFQKPGAWDADNSNPVSRNVNQSIVMHFYAKLFESLLFGAYQHTQNKAKLRKEYMEYSTKCKIQDFDRDIIQSIRSLAINNVQQMQLAALRVNIRFC